MPRLLEPDIFFPVTMAMDIPGSVAIMFRHMGPVSGNDIRAERAWARRSIDVYGANEIDLWRILKKDVERQRTAALFPRLIALQHEHADFWIHCGCDTYLDASLYDNSVELDWQIRLIRQLAWYWEFRRNAGHEVSAPSYQGVTALQVFPILGGALLPRILPARDTGGVHVLAIPSAFSTMQQLWLGACASCLEDPDASVWNARPVLTDGTVARLAAHPNIRGLVLQFLCADQDKRKRNAPEYAHAVSTKMPYFAHAAWHGRTERSFWSRDAGQMLSEFALASALGRRLTSGPGRPDDTAADHPADHVGFDIFSVGAARRAHAISLPGMHELEPLFAAKLYCGFLRATLALSHAAFYTGSINDTQWTAWRSQVEQRCTLLSRRCYAFAKDANARMSPDRRPAFLAGLGAVVALDHAMSRIVLAIEQCVDDAPLGPWFKMR